MRRFACILAAVALSPAALSQSTSYTYEYDALGQLVRVERGTGASSRVRYTYDAAGNRTQVKQGASAPVAVTDNEVVENTYGPWAIYPLYNDTDADFPFDSLTITGLSGTGSNYAGIQGGGTYIGVSAPDGNYTWSYTIQDSDGNSTPGTIYLTVFTICEWCW